MDFFLKLGSTALRGSCLDSYLCCDLSLAVASFLYRASEAAERASVGVPLSISHYRIVKMECYCKKAAC